MKVIWDYTYYWGVLAQIFFQQRLTDLAVLGSLRDELQHCQQLNIAAQAFFRAWSAVSHRRNPAVMLDQAALPWFAELNRSLNDTLGDEAFKRRMRQSVDRLATLAGEMLARAQRDHPGLDGGALAALLAQAPAPAGPAPQPLLFEAG